jgi:hypothetical protein
MRIVIETDDGQSARVGPESPTVGDETVTGSEQAQLQDDSQDAGSAPTGPPQPSRPDDTRPPTDAMSAGEGPGSTGSDTFSPPSVAVEQLATALAGIDSMATGDAASAGPAPSNL